MPAPERVVIDDRLLIEELLVVLSMETEVELHTTTYWYYRACRAAVAGGTGHLSGPFEQLGGGEQERGILSLLQLREDFSLPDPRAIIPVMAWLASLHPRLNVLNLEAAATAWYLTATVWLSEHSAGGALPPVLEAEDIAWRAITID